MNSLHGVLFDLDGTLLDTVPDLVFALNKLRNEIGLPDLPLETIRPIASLGSKAMIKLALGVDDTHPNYKRTREYFLTLYDKHLADSTYFFPEIETVLNYLDEAKIPWGIVTNKLTRHTLPLLKALSLEHRPKCVVCGDSLTKFKPDPAPILHACELLKINPSNCLYVGDAESDVIASKAAGTKSLVALYGYIAADEDTQAWNADGYVNTPIEIIDWIFKNR